MAGAYVAGSQHFSSQEPVASIQKPKGRSYAVAGAAGLGILLLAAIAFYALKPSKAPEPAAPQASMQVASIPEEPAVDLAPPLDTSMIPQREEATTTATPPHQPVELKTAATPDTSAANPKALPIPAAKPQPESGTITWSGNLEKNSILVLAEQTATIGSMEGRLPGQPVHIEVEPKDLLVRQHPGESNRWSQIILYSGNRKYSSITIRWKLIR